jgi:anti-sigma28 factor (negative regulator of flagellin synthesis)
MSRIDGGDADTWGVTVPSSEVRSMRVDQIRREIAEGSYDISGEAVAEAIIRFFSRD